MDKRHNNQVGGTVKTMPQRIKFDALLLLVSLIAGAGLSGCLTRTASGPGLPYVVPANVVPDVDRTALQLVGRMETMEAELRRLRDMVERVQASGGQEAAVKDLQERVSAIERELGIKPVQGNAVPTPEAQAQSEPAAQTLRVRAEASATQPPVVPDPAGPTPADAADRVEIRDAPIPPDEKAYRDAYLHVRRGSFKEALPILEDIVRNHPKSKFSADAIYGMGEALYGLGRYDEAVLQFDRVIKEFPGSKKELSALLKQGESFGKMGDSESARIIFERLVKDYPHTAQARAAQTRLKAMPKKN